MHQHKRRNHIKKLLLIVIVLCLGLTGAAFAIQTSTPLDISVNVVGGCTVTAPPMVFPDFVGTETQISHDITVNCTTGIPYDIMADMGLCGTTYGFPASSTRCLDDGAWVGNYLNYELYTDIVFPAAFGDWGLTKDFDILSGFGTGADDPVTIYGTIFSAPLQHMGLYSDIVNITVSYWLIRKSGQGDSPARFSH